MEREGGGEYPIEKDRLLTEPGLESSAILCSCYTRHTRLAGRKSTIRVKAGWCKDSKSEHSHIEGGYSFT